MKIKALAPWYGSKRTLAPQIVRALGPHRAYWEPFCGSLPVLLAKEPAQFETVNDLHGDLINLARVLAEEAAARELWQRLNRTLMHESLFREATERWRLRGHTEAGQTPDIERAYDFMLCSWLGRNGVAGTPRYDQGFCIRFTSRGGSAAKRWCSVVESIPAWHERLRHVTILNRDAFSIIERIEDADGVVIYCDPPYVTKGARYVHDFKPEDHERLAALLRRFQKTRVVVSYYDHPSLPALYAGWHVKQLSATKSLVNQFMRDRGGAVKAPEVLLINQPSYEEMF